MVFAITETYVDTRPSLSGGRVRPEELFIDAMRYVNFDFGIQKRQNDAFTGDMIRPVSVQLIRKGFCLGDLHTHQLPQLENACFSAPMSVDSPPPPLRACVGPKRDNTRENKAG